jgi:hypothetical protein
MTAPQVIQEIEAAGGVLALKGDKITYDIPKAARPLVDVLRQHRDEVLQTLRGRQDEAKRRISRWMAARCACPQNRRKVWGSEKSLYRNYLAWCQQCQQAPCSHEQFTAILDESFHRHLDGWQGLCLAVGWAAASKGLGSKPMYPAPMEVIQ